MIFTSLTFRALGRTHIASEPCVAIAMLCFDSTVGFPWSVPVLTQQFDVESRSHTCTAPLHAPPSERERDACLRGRPRGTSACKDRERGEQAPLTPAPSTPAFGPGPLGISPALPRHALLPGTTGGRERSRPHPRPPATRGLTRALYSPRQDTRPPPGQSSPCSQSHSFSRSYGASLPTSLTHVILLD